MKRLSAVLKKKLHPFLGYAFLVGAGAMAISGTASYVGPEFDNYAAHPTPPAVQTPAPRPPEARPPDLASLKAAAAQFAVQLGAIKASATELQRNGRPPSSELLDAIGQGEQLTTVIAQANTLSDIGNFDAGAKLEAIGRAISENSKF